MYVNMKIVCERRLVMGKIEDFSVEMVQGLNGPVSHAECDVFGLRGGE